MALILLKKSSNNQRPEIIFPSNICPEKLIFFSQSKTVSFTKQLYSDSKKPSDKTSPPKIIFVPTEAYKTNTNIKIPIANPDGLELSQKSNEFIQKAITDVQDTNAANKSDMNFFVLPCIEGNEHITNENSSNEKSLIRKENENGTKIINIMSLMDSEIKKENFSDSEIQNILSSLDFEIKQENESDSEVPDYPSSKNIEIKKEVESDSEIPNQSSTMILKTKNKIESDSDVQKILPSTEIEAKNSEIDFETTTFSKTEIIKETESEVEIHNSSSIDLEMKKKVESKPEVSDILPHIDLKINKKIDLDPNILIEMSTINSQIKTKVSQDLKVPIITTAIPSMTLKKTIPTYLKISGPIRTSFQTHSKDVLEAASTLLSLSGTPVQLLPSRQAILNKNVFTMKPQIAPDKKPQIVLAKKQLDPAIKPQLDPAKKPLLTLTKKPQLTLAKKPHLSPAKRPLLAPKPKNLNENNPTTYKPHFQPLFYHDFLKKHLDEKTYGDRLEWVKENKVFRVKMYHKNKKDWNPEDFKVFLDWDKAKGREMNSENPLATFTMSKQRFRTTLGKIREIKEIGIEIHPGYRYYRVNEHEVNLRKRKRKLIFGTSQDAEKDGPMPNQVNLE